MICNVCKEAGALTESMGEGMSLEDAKALHNDCPGGTHCDCQHKPTSKQDDGSRSQRRT